MRPGIANGDSFFTAKLRDDVDMLPEKLCFAAIVIMVANGGNFASLNISFLLMLLQINECLSTVDKFLSFM